MTHGSIFVCTVFSSVEFEAFGNGNDLSRWETSRSTGLKRGRLDSTSFPCLSCMMAFGFETRTQGVEDHFRSDETSKTTNVPNLRTGFDLPQRIGRDSRELLLVGTWSFGRSETCVFPPLVVFWGFSLRLLFVWQGVSFRWIQRIHPKHSIFTCRHGSMWDGRRRRFAYVRMGCRKEG